MPTRTKYKTPTGRRVQTRRRSQGGARVIAWTDGTGRAGVHVELIFRPGRISFGTHSDQSAEPSACRQPDLHGWTPPDSLGTAGPVGIVEAALMQTAVVDLLKTEDRRRRMGSTNGGGR